MSRTMLTKSYAVQPRPWHFQALAEAFDGPDGIERLAALAALGDTPGHQFLAYTLYPIGFIAVIIGRAQLFTENTLYPVALILSERRHVLDTARLMGCCVRVQHSRG